MTGTTESVLFLFSRLRKLSELSSNIAGPVFLRPLIDDDVCHCLPLTTQDHPAEDSSPLWSAISFDYSTLAGTLGGICRRRGLRKLAFVRRAFYDQQIALILIDRVNKGSCCQVGNGLE